MGIFDALLGLKTNSALNKATGQANQLVNATTGVTNNLLTDAAGNARTDLTGGVNNALASLASGYNQGASDLTNDTGQARDALTGGVGQAVNTVQRSNAAFQPFAAIGTAANGMLGNALGRQCSGHVGVPSRPRLSVVGGSCHGCSRPESRKPGLPAVRAHETD